MSEGIVSKPGRSGAMAGAFPGETVMPDPLINEQGYRLLKYDSWGQSVYVSQKQYREIMGEPKHRTHRKRKRATKGKRR